MNELRSKPEAEQYTKKREANHPLYIDAFPSAVSVNFEIPFWMKFSGWFRICRRDGKSSLRIPEGATLGKWFLRVRIVGKSRESCFDLLKDWGITGINADSDEFRGEVSWVIDDWWKLSRLEAAVWAFLENGRSCCRKNGGRPWWIVAFLKLLFSLRGTREVVPELFQERLSFL